MATNTIEIQIRSRLDQQGKGGLSALQASLGRIAEFAIGGLLTRGLSALGSGITNLGRNAVSAAGEMQNLGIALEGLVAREMSGGLQRMTFVSEEVVKAYEEAKQNLIDIDKDYAKERETIQADLGERLADVAKDTTERLLELDYDYTERISRLTRSIADLQTDYEYDRAERAEDTARTLTRMEEDYTHDRAGLVKDLAEAETEAEKARIQERIDELDYEYNLRKKRKEEDAAEADQDAKDAADQRIAQLQRQISDETREYERQRDALKKLGDERLAAVQERYAEELAAAEERYNQELAKAKEIVAEIEKENPKLLVDVQVDTQPIMDYQAALQNAGPAAEELMNWLRQLSIQSPFEYSKVADVFRFTMAMGASTEQAKGVTAAMLDMAAGMGLSGERLDRFSYNLGQALIQGDLSAANLRQLRMVGIDLAQILEGELGMSLSEIQEKMKSGEVSTQQLVDAFAGYAAETFGGAATRMSRTLTGLQSSFNDLFFFAGGDLLTPAIEVVSGALGELFDSLNVMMESGAFKAMGEQIGVVLDKGIGLAEAIMNTGANSDLTKEKMAAIFGEDSPISKALIGLLENVGKLGDVMAGIASDPVFQEYMAKIGDFLLNTLTPAVIELGGQMIGALADGIKLVADLTRDSLIPALEGAWDWFENKLLPILERIWAGINEHLAPAFQHIIDNMNILRDDSLPGAYGQFDLTAQALESIFTVVEKLIVPLSDLLIWASDIQLKIQPLLDMLNPFSILLDIIGQHVKNIGDQMAFLMGKIEEAGGPLALIKGAFEGIRDAVQGVLDKIGLLLLKLPEIKIPDILTQHSPSPFEQSFLDLGAAMGSVSQMAVPSFQSSFSGIGSPPALAPAYAGAGAAGGGGGTTVNIFTNALMGFSDAYDLARQLEPILNDWDRNKPK